MALFAGVAAAAQASDPTGIYAYVDRVVLEPSEAAPERIQVWGGFALANPTNRAAYLPAEKGYLYFKLPAGQETVSRKEWSDLKSIAGTGQLVAFGSRNSTNRATLRKADAKVENPDLYANGWGLTKVNPRNYSPLKQLTQLQATKSEGKNPPKSPDR
jgi:hypothetical protein